MRVQRSTLGIVVIGVGGEPVTRGAERIELGEHYCSVLPLHGVAACYLPANPERAA
jgi:hypothetical protein